MIFKQATQILRDTLTFSPQIPAAELGRKAPHISKVTSPCSREWTTPAPRPPLSSTLGPASELLLKNGSPQRGLKRDKPSELK